MRFVLPMLLFFTLAANAATVRVGSSIGQALAEAKAGDTILIEGPAVFHEHITVDQPLRLLGTNGPVLDGDGGGTPLSIEGTNAEVRGLTVRHGGNDLGNFDSGIMIAAPQVTVADCRVEGGGFGIYIRGVDECQVERNTVIGNTNVAVSKRGNGIHLWKTRRNIIRDNFITGTRDGAYFSYADRNVIAGNRIEHTRFGIHYMYSNENQLLGNTLTANAVGAALMFARNCQVEGNRAMANRRHGILLKQVERSRFVRNAVWGQNRGFFIQQAAQNRFEENLIAQNDIGLYLSNGSEQNVFTGNAFVRNTDQIWQPRDEVELGRLASNRFDEKRQGNYWSDYTGSDADGDGVGDTPYHETDLYGYMVDRHPEARVFALSPAAALLRKGEELLPLLNTEGVTDRFPLMRPPGAVVAMMPGSYKTPPNTLKPTPIGNSTRLLPGLRPGGTFDNSPTFQRWVTPDIRHLSPEGTADVVHNAHSLRRTSGARCKLCVLRVSVFDTHARNLTTVPCAVSPRPCLSVAALPRCALLTTCRNAVDLDSAAPRQS